MLEAPFLTYQTKIIFTPVPKSVSHYPVLFLLLHLSPSATLIVYHLSPLGNKIHEARKLLSVFFSVESQVSSIIPGS